MAQEKGDLRRVMRERLRSIPEDIFKKNGQKISRLLLNFLSELESKHQKKLSIGGFYPELKLFEPLWHTEILARFGSQLSFPARNKSGQMSFYQARIDELKLGDDFGVAMMLPPKKSENIPDLLLVPGLAFSKNGARLGRGKGFYDGYLKDFKGIKIGVLFSCQIENEVPVEPHDESLDFLITENEILRLSR